MYNIKKAAARAGVSVPVLRAWERRYGIIKPDRTAGGYRQFDDADVARIRTMRRLVDEGWSPSAAASAIIAGAVDVELDGEPAPLGGAGSVANRALGRAEVDDGPTAAAELADRFVAGARALDSRAIAAALDDLFARGSFERVVSELLFPALEALGDAWAAGSVSVAGEHLASNAALRRLGQALDAAGPAPTARAGRILVGLPPGGRHELGALAFAVAARRAGLPVAYLGPDLPTDDWLAASDRAAAAVIGAVTPRDRAAALEVASRLGIAYPDLVVALAGRHAPPSTAFLHLPPGLRDAVAALEAALAAPAAGHGRPSSTPLADPA
ncbi:MAG TPA: MerR family transcriptional regulator [Candidatus Limnocylindrales bacterium]|nr:MerR family transcriptional regulator [Candidatus Limnocylindrales bacterium]